MPTPNETITEISAVADPSRPSRIQLACPEEASTGATTAEWYRVDPALYGQDITAASTASPCPSEDRASEQTATTSPMPAADEEEVYAVAPGATAAVATAAAEQRETPEKSTQTVSSPTAAQKTFSRRSTSIGSISSLDCPSTPSPDSGYSTKRVPPSYSCSFLRPGSKFVGKQTSDRSTYEVHVELKHVNMADSFLCGYLRIKGLTEDHPTLTTYFEGEMIGDRYSFQTRRPEWGSNEKNDLAHWSRFPAFRPLVSKVKRTEFNYTNFAQKENIFMRWKEYFLVPDHRVRQISGASFEGFYYICFNQVSGTVDGIYFHAKSEKFQKLQLKHVSERTFACVEFR